MSPGGIGDPAYETQAYLNRKEEKSETECRFCLYPFEAEEIDKGPLTDADSVKLTGMSVMIPIRGRLAK